VIFYIVFIICIKANDSFPLAGEDVTNTLTRSVSDASRPTLAFSPAASRRAICKEADGGRGLILHTDGATMRGSRSSALSAEKKEKKKKLVSFASAELCP
jgi:hypothetical protein